MWAQDERKHFKSGSSQSRPKLLISRPPFSRVLIKGEWCFFDSRADSFLTCLFLVISWLCSLTKYSVTLSARTGKERTVNIFFRRLKVNFLSLMSMSEHYGASLLTVPSGPAAFSIPPNPLSWSSHFYRRCAREGRGDGELPGGWRRGCIRFAGKLSYTAGRNCCVGKT